MAYTLPENLYPNSYSFSSSDLSIFNAENGKIKTRPLKRGVVYISMSWTLSELDYIDFIDMYNIYLDYGIEPFKADIEGDGEVSTYNFVVPFEITSSEGEFINISATVSKEVSECTVEQLEFNEYCENLISILALNDISFASNTNCNYEMIEFITCCEVLKDTLSGLDKRY